MMEAAGSDTTGSVITNGDDNEKTSLWSDVPRRLFTICVGVPLIWKILERRVTAYLFFFGAHALSAWEYSFLEPAVTTAGIDQGQPQLLSPQQQQLSKRKRVLFCMTSLLLAAIPDSLISLFPFALSLSAGIFAVANRHHWVVGLLVVTIPFRAWCNLVCEFESERSTSDPSLSSSPFASTIAVLLTVWNADTGALVAGRLLGRRGKTTTEKMTGRRQNSDSNDVPSWIGRISPAKTMEGFLGGIAGGAGTAVWAVPLLLNSFSINTSPVFRRLWGLDSTIEHDEDGFGTVTDSNGGVINRLFLGLCLSVLAILGDLVESSIKRRSHAKDSGAILPGHGGILDRFDSSLLAIMFYRVALEQTTAMVSEVNNTHTNMQQENVEL